MEAALVALRRAMSQALSAVERGKPAVVDPGRSARADRIMARWRAQPPFHKAGWFDRRLAADGLTVEVVHDQLAEPPDALADRVGLGHAGATAEVAGGSWVDELVAAFATPAPIELPAEHDLAAVAGPLLTAAAGRLRTALAPLGDTPFGDPDAAVARFLPSLTAHAYALTQRSMVLEVQVAKVTGALTADTPTGRYRQFLDRLRDPGIAAGLLAEYPVLARRLVTVCRNWVTASAELVHRLVADLPELSARFAGGAPLGAVTQLETDLGDRHRGGRTVARLRFEHGVRILYKPRSLAVDAHYQQLVAWLNGYLRWPLAELPCLARDGYGWVAHVQQRYCSDGADLHRFYHRAGTLTALLYLLEATDCHAQNLIAVGDQPVLIDHETLLTPRLREDLHELSAAELVANTAIGGSVLRSGMLPYRAWVEVGNGGADVSALGWDPRELPPREIPELRDAGTDEVRVGYRRVGIGQVASRPLPPGEPLRLADFRADLDAGFTEAYRILAGHREAVRELLDAFADDEIRVLCRETMEYRTLVVAGLHPDRLRDGLAADRHLDRLWELVPRLEAVAPLLASERADLAATDVPVFTARPGGTALCDAAGRKLPAVSDEPALSLALAKLDALGEDDLAAQRSLLRWAVESSRTDHVPQADGTVAAVVPAAPLPAADRVAARALEYAGRAADRLVALAYRRDGSLAWAGPGLLPGGAWALAPLGADLYSGTAGVTLFLARLAEVTGDAAHRAAAAGALDTLRAQVLRLPRNLAGGLCGYGGVLYALAHLHAIRPDEELAALADNMAAGVGELATDDAEYDVISGAAGSIAGLAAWHAVRPSAAVRTAVAACADQLCARAERQPAGVGWRAASMADVSPRPLAGFAHGAAGPAWALARAATVTGDRRYLPTAAAALAYERSLFDAAAGNWPDVRTGIPHEASFPVLWCHGAVGLGLSRTGLLAAARELGVADLGSDQSAGGGVGGAGTVAELTADLRTALDTAAAAGFGWNFSLCHGDLGALDLFCTAPAVLDEAAAAAAGETALRQTAAILDRLDERGWVCGLAGGGENPALLVGLAGIGYGLLRAAAPDRVPSVLALHPPVAGRNGSSG
ncbi:type 2 lanthipeptide synthetase LanM family protein [Actinocatenispora sera]|uniref:Lanthionine synthetase n=1 Tax=Actinocatenispora sera TaxID=390989 RepID=A0A810LDW1_9ACTN|nr:type 2 lanthipeptide synthetase LanM family protein [Actinocatenispora sera]BCJ32401.1 lanthionine synthetase [Actinocatenispora sera]